MNKRSFLITVFLFLSYAFCFGQNDEVPKKYKKYLANPYYYLKGYIVKKNDTIQGLVHKRSYKSEYYRNLQFVHETGDKITYEANQIQAYGFEENQFLSIKNSFYKVIYKGTNFLLVDNIMVFNSPSSYEKNHTHSFYFPADGTIIRYDNDLHLKLEEECQNKPGFPLYKDVENVAKFYDLCSNNN